MKYRVGDEVFIKGRVMGVNTTTPYDQHPILFYQVDIGETGMIMVSENKITDITKLVKPTKVIDAKEHQKNHFR